MIFVVLTAALAALQAGILGYSYHAGNWPPSGISIGSAAASFACFILCLVIWRRW